MRPSCFEICVKNRPSNMKENDLSKICSQYGHVVRVYFPPALPKLAFVGFSNYSESELAVKQLNGLSLGLDAEFAKKNIPNSSNLRRSASTDNIKQNSFQKSNNNLIKNHATINFSGHTSNSSHEETPKIGKCTLCKNIADLICERCKDFYCSVDCQIKDWAAHRYICFTMPKLISSTVGHSQTIEHIPSECTRGSSNTRNHVGSSQINLSTTSKVSSVPKTSTFENNRPPNKNSYMIPINNAEAHDVQLSSPNSIASNTVNNVSKQHELNDLKNLNNNNNYKNKEVECPIISTSTPIAEFTEFPKNNSNVTITSFLNAKDCFVRSMDFKLNTEYIHLLNEITEYSKNAKFLTVRPSACDIVLADFKNTGYSRALILDSDDMNRIKIVYLDYGYYDVKCYKELKELSEKLRKSKKFIHRCLLKGVNESLSNTKVIDFMNTLVNEVIELKIGYNEPYKKNVTECEMLIFQSNQNLNIKINNLMLIEDNRDLENKSIENASNVMSIKSNQVVKQQVLMYEDLKIRDLPTGENIEIYILDKKLLKEGIVSCTDYRGLEELGDINGQIKKYCNQISDESYKPMENEMCLVRYENMWSRGLCVEHLEDENVFILFVDFGSTNVVNVVDIRRIPIEFSHPPIVTVCTISELPKDMSNSFYENLNTVIPNNTKILADRIESIKNVDDDEKTTIIYITSILNKINK